MMPALSAADLLLSLGLTLALEVPFAYLWGLRGRHDLTLCVLVNVLTNPAVVAAYWYLACRTGAPRLALQLPLEAAAVAVEAACYAGCGRNIRRPVLLSLCANAWSYGAGLLLAALA